MRKIDEIIENLQMLGSSPGMCSSRTSKMICKIKKPKDGDFFEQCERRHPLVFEF